MVVQQFTWCNSIRYLGENIESGSCFKVDTDIVRRKFFASCNTILSNSVHQSELLHLNLMECYSLPILQYCVAAIKFTDTVKFLVFIDASQSKRSFVALGVLILNIYMLLDVLNSGRVCTLAPMLG